ncbi:hypothetical protein [Mycobacterium sp. C31M]
MSAKTIDGFVYSTQVGADGIELNVAVGGSGPAVVLTHCCFDPLKPPGGAAHHHHR